MLIWEGVVIMRLRFYVKEAIMSRTLTIKSKTKKEEQNLTILYARLSKDDGKVW